MRRFGQLLLMSLSFVGVIAGEQRASVAPVVATPTAEPVIVRLASRQRIITILAGKGRTLYSVTDPSGRAIVSRASLDDLRVNYPEIYHQVAPGVALYAGLGD